MYQDFLVALHAPLWAWLFKRSWERSRHRSHPVIDDDSLASNPHLVVIHQLIDSVPNLLPSPSLPLPLSSTPLHWVNTAPALVAVAADLFVAPRIALDTEHHSRHSYTGITCLLQLSTGEMDYIIDTLALKTSMHLLAPVLADPGILKIVHGGGSDVAWLLRDFGLHIVNIFDTEKACQTLGYQQRSLAHLLWRWCSVAVDKTLQRADWRQRPLPLALMHYARSDVHWLLYIAECLGQELLAAGQGHILRVANGTMPHRSDAAEEGNLRITHTQTEMNQRVAAHGLSMPDSLDPASPLGRAVHRSQILSLTEHTPVAPGAATAAATLAIMKAHIASLREQLGLLAAFSAAEVEELERVATRVHALSTWRDARARELDDGVQCVLPDAVLLALTLERTVNAKGVVGTVGAVPEHAYPDACCFPGEVLRNSKHISSLLRGAERGQVKWTHPDLHPLMLPQSGLDAQSRRKKGDAAALRKRLGERFGTKHTPYENCRMLAADGKLLAYTDKKRLLWYVSKGLATVVAPDPLTVQLTFEHKDDDQRSGNHEFYTAARLNRCVTCGETGHYLRYRVVPACYRRALPVELKSHRSHDVVLLCISCHELAQTAAERMKRTVSEEYGIPLFPPSPVSTPVDGANAASNGAGSTQPGVHPYTVRKAALALQRKRDQMPEARRQELESLIASFTTAVEPWVAEMVGEITAEAGTASGVVYSPPMLWAALLAGMSSQSRRRTIRRWIGEGQALPDALVAELEDADVRAGRSASAFGSNAAGQDARALGHMSHAWHGLRVVEAAAAQGGEAEIAALCARFRKVFVDALQPRYLPVGWEVDHKAPRAFGPHSVYAPAAFHGRAGVAEGDDGPSKQQETIEDA